MSSKFIAEKEFVVFFKNKVTQKYEAKLERAGIDFLDSETIHSTTPILRKVRKLIKARTTHFAPALARQAIDVSA